MGAAGKVLESKGRAGSRSMVPWVVVTGDDEDLEEITANSFSGRGRGAAGKVLESKRRAGSRGLLGLFTGGEFPV